MKKGEDAKPVAKPKPKMRGLFSIFTPVRPDMASGLRRKEKSSDWHPCSGPFPTD